MIEKQQKPQNKMKTTYIEIPLYPDNDAVFYSGDWNQEESVLAFEMTDEELYKLKEAYDSLDSYKDVVEFLMSIVSQENQFISQFWGYEGVYVDNMEDLEEAISEL